MDEKKMTKGFNYGYELAKLDQDLAKTIYTGYKGEKSDFILGFEKGMEELGTEIKAKNLKEQLVSRYKDSVPPPQIDNPEKDRGRGFEK